MEERRPRERELVLAPNEYAYVLDTTKGHINCYVGPNKTSLAQTDQLVAFNEATKRFEAAELAGATRLFATAPANWYLSLKNPARENLHPTPGVSSSGVELQVGRKLNVPGPTSFALWPGQMARVIEGHRLQSNQYLLIQIYDAEEAGRSWRAVLGLPPSAPEPAGGVPGFVVGQQRIIQGTDVSFYIPPNGVEVMPDQSGAYVRDAVTLQRLEYCILVGEDGRKTFVRGEAVVFPEPSQMFVENQGERRFKALELSEISGIYIKVIAPYTDEDGVNHVEGEELFLTGKNKLYFPREEHAIIRYGDQELHYAVAVPPGEGRYVLNRLTGEISLRRGPVMFLPDPRKEVVTRRVLSDRECRLLYPNNEEALAYNRVQRAAMDGRNALDPEPARQPTLMAGMSTKLSRALAAKESAEAGSFEGDAFARKQRFTGPRTITLNTKYDGAVNVDVWSGYAIQLVNKAGGRRVVQGPCSVLMEYNETLEALALSTGTPKTTEKLLQTVFLQVHGNQVSDRVEVVTNDLVHAHVLLKYRVNFEGDNNPKWFAVDNYVKLLCDHASSIVKAAVRQVGIQRLRTHVAELVRDAVLGKKPDGGDRAGMAFAENDMRIHDVEVLDVTVTDKDVAELLVAAQIQSIQQAIGVAEKDAALTHARRAHEIDRALLQENEVTRALTVQLEAAHDQRLHAQEEARAARRSALQAAARMAEQDDAAAAFKVAQEQLHTLMARHELELRQRTDRQVLELQAMEARVAGAVKQAQAFSPELTAALQRLGDAQLLSSLAENFGGLAAVEGKALLETARKFLDFVPGSMLPVLKAPGQGSVVVPQAAEKTSG